MIKWLKIQKKKLIPVIIILILKNLKPFLISFPHVFYLDFLKMKFDHNKTWKWRHNEGHQYGKGREIGRYPDEDEVAAIMAKVVK